jgi:hypothetical protein
VVAVAVGDEDVGQVPVLAGDPVAEHARLIRRQRGIGEHGVLVAVDQRAGLGREPLRLAIRKDTSLGRRVVDEDLVGEAHGSSLQRLS